MKYILYSIFKIPGYLYLEMLTYFPGQLGIFMRYRYWKKRMLFLGKNVRIDIGVQFQNPKYISIDDYSWIDRYTILLAGKDQSNRHRRNCPNNDYKYNKGYIIIGKKVHIAPFCIISGISGVHISDECGLSSNVKIYSFSNHYRSDDDPANSTYHFGPLVGHDRQYMIEGPIYLGNNVGVALNSIILPGVTIGKNSFVSINSVVGTSFVENSLIGGSPARYLKNRFQ